MPRTARESTLPTAESEEVLMACTQKRGFRELLQRKRVTIEMAQNVLETLRRLLAQNGKPIFDDDERIAPLVRYIHKQRRLANMRASTEPKRLGQSVQYKAQTNTQRKTKFASIPLSPSFETNGRTITAIKVVFEEERIIITRAR